MVLAKNASKFTCFRCSGVIRILAMGVIILSNLACMAFFNYRRRVPFLSCTSSSLGRLMAMVFPPALAEPA